MEIMTFIQTISLPVFMVNFNVYILQGRYIFTTINIKFMDTHVRDVSRILIVLFPGGGGTTQRSIQLFIA